MKIGEWINSFATNNNIQLPDNIPSDKCALKFLQIEQGIITPKLIHEEEVDILNFTTTNSTKIKDISVDLTNPKYLYLIQIHDTAGWRKGYHYGSNSVVQNVGQVGSDAYIAKTMYRLTANGDVKTNTTPYGVSVNRYDFSDKILQINAWYNATNGLLIDGKFKISIYALNIAPISGIVKYEGE